MVWIGGVVVIGLVASNAGVWGISVVISLVTGIAIKRDMGPCQDIIVVMNGESSWFPSRQRGMTGAAIGGNVDGCMIWIDRLIVILAMAAVAHGGCADVASGMTFNAFGG